MADDGYLLSRDSVEHLSRAFREVDTSFETQGWGYPSGFASDDQMFAEILSATGSGQYTAQQRFYNSASLTYDTPQDPFSFNASSEPGVLTEVSRTDDVQVGSIVRIWDDVDDNGNVAWFFEAGVSQTYVPPRLCYGTWTITWDVSSGSIPIEGELIILAGYTNVRIHIVDNDGSTRLEWLNQFKIGDIIKVATTGSGVGVYFEITSATNVGGDYYDYEVDVCDVTNKALVPDDADVTLCLGLVCSIETYDVDLDEGPGIGIVEAPADTFKISCLLEEGTCITITEQGDGNPINIAVDLSCIGTSIDWKLYVDVGDSLEWADSPDNFIHLKGDEATPPDYTLYAYLDSLATRGWYYLNDLLVDTNSIRVTSPTGQEVSLEVATQMSITEDASGLKLVNDETTPTDYTLYGKVGSKGWQDIAEYFDSSSTISKSGGGGALLEFNIEFTANSSVVDNGGVELSGDESAPGSHHYYGTDYAGGTKGWENFTLKTVITDIQLDANNDLEYKTTQMYVVDPQTESAWLPVAGWSTTDCPTP